MCHDKNNVQRFTNEKENDYFGVVTFYRHKRFEN